MYVYTNATFKVQMHVFKILKGLHLEGAYAAVENSQYAFNFQLQQNWLNPVKLEMLDQIGFEAIKYLSLILVRKGLTKKQHVIKPILLVFKSFLGVQV